MYILLETLKFALLSRTIFKNLQIVVDNFDLERYNAYIGGTYVQREI